MMAVSETSAAGQVLAVEREQERSRLDRFLAARLAPEYSRSQVARMIKAGLVKLNGRVARASAILKAADQIEISPPPTPAVVPKPQFAPEIEILYADTEIIVVNKPAGMTVHPAPGHPHGTLVDALMASFPELAAMVEPDGVVRPGIVHRLDKETSGVMVVARTPFARTELSRQFKERIVRKAYLAIVRGIVAHDHFSISRPLGRHPTERKRMSVRSRHPREAVTRVEVIQRFDKQAEPATLVRVRPETGRTHQIRVHLASVGHPCLGDPLYGKGPQGLREEQTVVFKRQALHAVAISIVHPRRGERMAFVAAIPEDMTGYLKAAGLDPAVQGMSRWTGTDF